MNGGDRKGEGGKGGVDQGKSDGGNKLMCADVRVGGG